MKEILAEFEEFAREKGREVENREVYFNNNGQKAIVLGFMTEMWERGKK